MIRLYSEKEAAGLLALSYGFLKELRIRKQIVYICISRIVQ